MSTLNLPIVPTPIKHPLELCKESRVNLLSNKQTRRITLQVYEATQELLSEGGASDYTHLLEDAFAELVESTYFEKEYGHVKGITLARMQKLVLFLTRMEATDDRIFEKVQKKLKNRIAEATVKGKEVGHVSA